MTDAQLVQFIYTAGGSVFLLALFTGFARTLARGLYYLRHKKDRPRLLNRDLLWGGGVSISFGLITVIRFLPPDTRIALTQGNVAWAVLTSVPACIGVLVYAYYEFFVIERPSDTA